MKSYRRQLGRFALVMLLAAPGAAGAGGGSEITIEGLLKAMTDTLTGATSITSSQANPYWSNAVGLST